MLCSAYLARDLAMMVEVATGAVTETRTGQGYARIAVGHVHRGAQYTQPEIWSRSTQSGAPVSGLAHRQEASISRGHSYLG
jgi:hypothetical protein